MSAPLDSAPSGRPGCSLLVLTYNQERYVADAVAGALAQTGPPVEVLISDDASTDRTFEIARGLATGYQGPHRVVLNRNPVNIGLIAHINQAVTQARGDILIPAYGDDISLPQRAARIAQVFARYDPLLVHSQARPIDAQGHETTSAYRDALFFRTTEPAAIATSLVHYLGASGGWSRTLFDLFGPIREAEVYDDHVLGFRAALMGRVHLIDEVLLEYRDGVGLSHDKRAQPTREANRRQRRKLLAQAAAVYRARLEDAHLVGRRAGDPVVDSLVRACRTAEARQTYYQGLGLSAMLHAPGPWLAEALRDLRKR
ncbi:MAG: glycosyltransferase [Pseudomonadota bacterium]